MSAFGIFMILLLAGIVILVLLEGKNSSYSMPLTEEEFEEERVNRAKSRRILQECLDQRVQELRNLSFEELLDVDEVKGVEVLGQRSWINVHSSHSLTEERPPESLMIIVVGIWNDNVQCADGFYKRRDGSIHPITPYELRVEIYESYDEELGD